MAHCASPLRLGAVHKPIALTSMPLPPTVLPSSRSSSPRTPTRLAAVASATSFTAPYPSASGQSFTSILAPSRPEVDSFLSRYALGAPLGQGAMGTVVAALSKVSGEEVAVKIVSKNKLADRHQRMALNREAQLWRRACAATKQACQFIAIEEDYENWYIVSEKCNGGSLQQMLESRGVLAEGEVSQVAWCVLAFLADMHSHGIYYGDLKPGNVILKDMYPCDVDSAAGCLNVRVVDFGCAQLVSNSGPLRALSGSPLFLAPEILDGAYSLPADMWAFGVMLYMLVANRLPFWLEPIEQLEGMDLDALSTAVHYTPVLFAGAKWKGVSEDLKDLICGLLEKDPSRRLTAEKAMAHPWFAQTRETCGFA